MMGSVFCTISDIGGTPMMIYILSLQWGQTALIKASKAGKVECVKVLLDRDAEINMLDKVSGVILPVNTRNAACIHVVPSRE